MITASEALDISKKNGWKNAHNKMFDEIESKIKSYAEAGNVCTEFTVELDTTNMQFCLAYVTAISSKLENLGYTTKIGTALINDKTQIPITISWFSGNEVDL